MAGETVTDVSMGAFRSVSDAMVTVEGLLDGSRVEVLYTVDGGTSMETDRVFPPGELRRYALEFDGETAEVSDDNEVVTVAAEMESEAIEVVFRVRKVVDAQTGETVVEPLE